MIFIFASVFAVSVIPVIVFLLFSKKLYQIKEHSHILVSFASGTLFGDVFLHLIPSAFNKQINTLSASLAITFGLLLFFMLEKFICWRHCHTPEGVGHHHPFVFMNLIGDGVHNLIDGAVIAASYAASPQIGIATTIAVLAHEIPQEIGDFSVLIHAGLSKNKALLVNLLSALLCFFGAFVAILFGAFSQNISGFLIPIVAGGFIYIAGSDLVPELKKHTGAKESSMQFLSMLFGIGIMLLLFLWND